MSRFRRLTTSCAYAGLIDGSLLRSARRNVNRNVHQIIVLNGQFEYGPVIDAAPDTHTSNAFLIGIRNYSSSGGIHSNHVVSALLIRAKLYCFNAHGNLSQPMRWLIPFLRQLGFNILDYIQYNGANLQEFDTSVTGVCSALSTRFIRLNPNSGMTQAQFDSYVERELSLNTMQNLTRYVNEPLTSIRNVGQRSNNRNNTRNLRRRRPIYESFAMYQSRMRNARERRINANFTNMNQSELNRVRRMNREFTTALSAMNITDGSNVLRRLLRNLSNSEANAVVRYYES